jgi:hypothetical protein
MALRAVLADLVRGGRVEKGEDGRVTVANMGSRRTGTALAAAGTIDILEAAADGLAEAVGPADSADGRGQTDTKTDKPKKRIRSFPRESALLELAEKIKAGRRAGVTDIEVARGFCEEDEKNATRMLRRLRDYPHLLK